MTTIIVKTPHHDTTQYIRNSYNNSYTYYTSPNTLHPKKSMYLSIYLYHIYSITKLHMKLSYSNIQFEPNSHCLSQVVVHPSNMDIQTHIIYVYIYIYIHSATHSAVDIIYTVHRYICIIIHHHHGSRNTSFSRSRAFFKYFFLTSASCKIRRKNDTPQQKL